MSRPFVARYGGRCAAECGQPIREGDDVVYEDDEIVHVDCEGKTEPPQPERPRLCPLLDRARRGVHVSNRRKIRAASQPRRTLPVDQAYWNGLPTTAVRGTAIVADAPEFPQYWARTENIIGQRIPVVMVDLDGVNYGGGVTYLDDRDGSGWAKVTNGHGSPRYGHRGVGIEDGSFRPASPETTPRGTGSNLPRGVADPSFPAQP